MANEKYEGINPLSKLREGEPYFFLRAQDQLAPAAVSAYADLLNEQSQKMRDTAPEIADRLLKDAIRCQQFASSMLEWQGENEQFVKLPD